MNNEYICELIREMGNEWYPEPTAYHRLPQTIFLYQSYNHWAIQEIIRYLKERPNQLAELTIEEFRHKMDCFACETKDENKNFMFSAAYDVATDVLDLILRLHSGDDSF